MNPNDVFGRPWAIRQDNLEALAEMARLHAGGEEAGMFFFGPQVWKGKPEDLVTVVDGVAVIPIAGTLEKTSWEFPGMDVIGEAFDLAVKAKRVRAIVLDIDSPGGMVDGTPELAERIRAARGTKPIVAFANGLMTSAAYWVGSAADTVIAAPTATVGSIGVAMLHRDFSKALEEMGIKETPITAGKFKRIASREKPLSEEAREYLQEKVDDIYALFVDSVAKHRGVTREKAMEMADGKEFIGEKARAVGLVDFIGTLATARAKANERSIRLMTPEELKSQFPDLHKAVRDEGYAEGLHEGEKTALEVGLAEGIQKGSADERARVLSLLEAKADPAVTLEAIKAGTQEAAAYRMFFEAERSKRASSLEELAAAAPPAIGHAAPSAATGNTFEAEVDQRVKAGATRSAAITAVVAQFPELHAAYVNRINKKKE